jgi:hydrogenase small subunit
MPGFPDKFTPFYKIAPGSRVSSTTSKLVGAFIRPLRLYTNEHLNREVRWDIHHETPTGWARQRTEPGVLRETGHALYDQIRRSTDTGKKKNPAWGKRDEWTMRKEPAAEERLPGGPESTKESSEEARSERSPEGR